MENTLTASLVDTNILVYANNRDSSHHVVSKKLIEDALNGNIEAVLSIQNLTELYAIITDKKRVEHPLSCDKAKRIIELYVINDNISIIHPSYQTPYTITKLIEKYKPVGQSIFDYLLVATMFDNNITQIYTNNTKHFEHFEFLEVINPFSGK